MKKIISASILVLMTAGAALAQSGNANPRAFEASMAHFRANAKAYGLADADRELKQRNSLGDTLGQTHVRFDQYFNGVKVFEGEAISHVNKAGKVTVTDSIRRNLKVDTTPRVSEATAIATAISSMGVVGGFAYPTASLEILPAGDRSKATRLTWHIRIFAENDAADPMQRDYFVDAHDGSIAFAYDSLETGTGKSAYSGTVAIGTTPVSGGFSLKDAGRGTNGGNYTTDMKTRTNGGTLMTDTDDVWGDGIVDSANVQTTAVDAHYGLQLTWDYYKNVHGRNGIDNTGKQTYSRVHYSRRYDNAFWSDSCFCMTYGDGSGAPGVAGGFLPLASIDVAGHEMTHGVTSRSANLTYSGESGGLNEATSDIFGTAVEFNANNANDAGDWLIGEKIYPANYNTSGVYTATASTAKALRYMDKPSKDTRSPNCWSSTLGSIDVHYSSGPANHMFYLLSNGGTSACNSNAVTGIGIDKAAKIWYRALTVYMTASTNYAGARTAALNAASDLFGSASAERAAVAAAFSAINVN